MRNEALAFNVLITCFLFLLLRPRPIILYWSVISIGFWHITLFSDPQSTPPNISEGFAIFLPALFIAYGLWRLAVRFTLPLYLKAPIEYTIWYLGPFWVTVLSNMTMDKIPISRLTASDLSKRSGAITALVIIVVVVVLLAINQVRVARKTGWLPYYVGWYVAGGLVAMVLALLPGLQFRLHHYIIGIVVMPFTAFPTRLSAIYQGFLLGLFLNGGAAYGFDSILQTAEEVCYYYYLPYVPPYTVYLAPPGCCARIRYPHLSHQFKHIQLIDCPCDSKYLLGGATGRLGRFFPIGGRCPAICGPSPQFLLGCV